MVVKRTLNKFYTAKLHSFPQKAPSIEVLSITGINNIIFPILIIGVNLITPGTNVSPESFRVE